MCFQSHICYMLYLYIRVARAIQACAFRDMILYFKSHDSGLSEAYRFWLLLHFSNSCVQFDTTCAGVSKKHDVVYPKMQLPRGTLDSPYFGYQSFPPQTAFGHTALIFQQCWHTHKQKHDFTVPKPQLGVFSHIQLCVFGTTPVHIEKCVLPEQKYVCFWNESYRIVMVLKIQLRTQQMQVFPACKSIT